MQITTGSNVLSLREVQVWTSSTNVALTGTASMSSTSGGNVASNCIDGSTDAGSVYCVTNTQANPYWE